MIRIPNDCDASICVRDILHEFVLHDIRVLAVKESVRLRETNLVERLRLQFIYQHMLAPLYCTSMLREQFHTKDEQVVEVQAVHLPEVLFILSMDFSNRCLDVPGRFISRLFPSFPRQPTSCVLEELLRTAAFGLGFGYKGENGSFFECNVFCSQIVLVRREQPSNDLLANRPS